LLTLLVYHSKERLFWIKSNKIMTDDKLFYSSDI